MVPPFETHADKLVLAGLVFTINNTIKMQINPERQYGNII
jgi:hypothetical protein